MSTSTGPSFAHLLLVIFVLLVNLLGETTATADVTADTPVDDTPPANCDTAPTCDNHVVDASATATAATTTTNTTAGATGPPNRFCELWKNHGYPYDMVAATSDDFWGEGRGEDMALVHAMRKLGRTATRASMQDYDYDWERMTKMIVIRSAWDKYSWIEEYWRFQRDVDEFSILMNPLSVLQWQAQKDLYMKQLKSKGIPMVDTVYVTIDDIKAKQQALPAKYDEDEEDEDEDEFEAIGKRGSPGLYVYQAVMDDVQRRLGCEDIIMKPAYGNGGVGVRRYPNGEWDFFHQLKVLIWAEEDTIMFQCFQRQILTKGERGIIFVGGEVTHGLLKLPKKSEGLPGEPEENYMVNTDFGGTWSVYQPTDDEVQFAQQVAAAVAESVGVWPAYLRVDIFNDNQDNLALMELAAGTANLWLEQVPKAADALARYLDAELTRHENECQAYYAEKDTLQASI